MGTVSRLVLSVVVAVVAIVATLMAVALFPPFVVMLLVAASIACAWWGIGGLRRHRSRLLSVVAVCASPVLMLAALAAMFAFAPISHSSDGPTQGTPSGIQHSPSP